MIEIKTSAELARMREAGRVVAVALERMRGAAAVGVTLRDLDELARDVLREFGATSAFEGYQPSWSMTPFPGVICASVNDVVVHGVPGTRALVDGDLVSIDFGAFVDGWCGDAAVTFTVGTARADDVALSDATREALGRGIAATLAGGRLGDVSHAIGTYARSIGYGILEGNGGHGIGRSMHEDPHVANEGRPGRGVVLRPGLVIALEPMLIADGTDAYRIDADGWTMLTRSGARAAHWEHTVAVTADGPQILTLT